VGRVTEEMKREKRDKEGWEGEREVGTGPLIG